MNKLEDNEKITILLLRLPYHRNFEFPEHKHRPSSLFGRVQKAGKTSSWCTLPHCQHVTRDGRLIGHNPFFPMSTPILLGLGAVATALAGRHLVKRGVLGLGGAAEKYVKGGFRQKMDRAEAIAILGLKYESRIWLKFSPDLFY